MANMVLAGIKFSDTALKPKEHDTKFEEYYKKFEEITLAWIKMCEELEGGNTLFTYPIHYKVSDIVGKTFKVDNNTYKFTTPCITQCIERFNEEQVDYKIVSKVPKSHYGQNNPKGRGKKILLMSENTPTTENEESEGSTE